MFTAIHPPGAPAAPPNPGLQSNPSSSHPASRRSRIRRARLPAFKNANSWPNSAMDTRPEPSSPPGGTWTPVFHASRKPLRWESPAAFTGNCFPQNGPTNTTCQRSRRPLGLSLTPMGLDAICWSHAQVPGRPRQRDAPRTAPAGRRVRAGGIPPHGPRRGGPAPEPGRVPPVVRRRPPLLRVRGRYPEGRSGGRGRRPRSIREPGLSRVLHRRPQKPLGSGSRGGAGGKGLRHSDDGRERSPLPGRRHPAATRPRVVRGPCRAGERLPHVPSLRQRRRPGRAPRPRRRSRSWSAPSSPSAARPWRTCRVRDRWPPGPCHARPLPALTRR